ncbi:Tn3 family transposase, partial [Deinococcus antarcticus]
ELFDLLTRELVLRQVILPGPTVLARIVLRVREGVATRFYRQISQRLTEEQRTRLNDLVTVPEKQRRSPLDILRTAPTRQKSSGLIQALRRLDDVRAVGVSGVKLGDIPQDRLRVLSRHALVAWAPSLAKLSTHRRAATLLAVIQHLEKSATDDALDIFDTIMAELSLSGEKLRRKSRLRTLKDLDQAALVLRDAVQVLLDSEVPAPTVRDIIFARLGEVSLKTAVASVTELASTTEDTEPQAWMEIAATTSRFLPTLLETLVFEGTTTAAPTLAALKFLRGEEGKRKSWKSAPVSFIPQSWQEIVRPAGVIDQRGYQVCAAYMLHTLLRKREIFVPVSFRYGDPRAQLLQGTEWERLRPELVRSLGWSLDPKVELDALSAQLNEAYQRTAKGL